MVRPDEDFGKDHGLIHEAVVTGRKVGAGQDFWAKLAHDEGLFRNVVALVMGNGTLAESAPSAIAAEIISKSRTSLNPAWLRAREIMGKNFLGVEEVMTHYKVMPTVEQLDALAEIPFSETELEECKDTHLLVAGFPMTILDVRAKAPSKKPKTFYSYKDAWYNTQAFATDEKVGLRWYLIRKTAVDSSFSKLFDNQKRLLGPKDEVPRACELVYAVVLYFMATGERLFSNTYVRTITLDADGYRVNVGYFVSGGLYVCRRWDAYPYGYVGLSSARKSIQ
jgi:hypothetical protein